MIRFSVNVKIINKINCIKLLLCCINNGLLLLINRLNSEAAVWKIFNYYRSAILGYGSYFGAVFKGELMNQKDNTIKYVAIKRIERERYTRSEESLGLLQMKLDSRNVVKLLHIEFIEEFV